MIFDLGTDHKCVRILATPPPPPNTPHTTHMRVSMCVCGSLRYFTFRQIARPKAH